jgi:hypothetical protein
MIRQLMSTILTLQIHFEATICTFLYYLYVVMAIKECSLNRWMNKNMFHSFHTQKFVIWLVYAFKILQKENGFCQKKSCKRKMDFASI